MVSVPDDSRATAAAAAALTLTGAAAAVQVPALWEALWTNPHTPHFHLYVALVLLQYKRKDILGPELHYGRMHEICASLRGTVDLQVRPRPANSPPPCSGRAPVPCGPLGDALWLLEPNQRKRGLNPGRGLASAGCPGGCLTVTVCWG